MDVLTVELLKSDQSKLFSYALALYEFMWMLDIGVCSNNCGLMMAALSHKSG